MVPSASINPRTATAEFSVRMGPVDPMASTALATAVGTSRLLHLQGEDRHGSGCCITDSTGLHQVTTGATADP
jgi:hypothetical protein